MSYATFLKALRKTPRKWRLTREDEIRLANMCPLSAPLRKHMVHYDAGANAFDIPDLGVVIARAADRVIPYNQRIRRDLLKACGLKERTK